MNYPVWGVACQLRRDLRMLFMGDSNLATILFVIGMTGGIAAISLMSHALRKECSSRCLSQALLLHRAIRRENPVVRVPVVSGAVYRRGHSLVRHAQAVRVIQPGTFCRYRE